MHTKSVAAITVASSAVVAGLHPTAGAEQLAPVRSDHCVLTVIGQEPSGEYLTSEPACYPTLSEALAEAGSPLSADIAAVEGLAAQGVLATHYALSGLTGSSISISGADCGGGYVNLGSGWTNRISSTRNYCPTVRFFEGFDKAGTSEPTTTLWANLTFMDDRSLSVSYGT